MEENIMLFDKMIKLLMTVSLVFLFACNNDNGSSSSSSSSSSSYSKSYCNLDKMLDEYQRMVDKLVSATNSFDTNKMMSLNQEIENLTSKWDNTLANSNCTTAEVLDASKRWMAITASMFNY